MTAPLQIDVRKRHDPAAPGEGVVPERAAEGPADVLSYVAVTPARNESPNLSRLASCMAEQTILPREWIIVDNGSTDDSAEIARQLAEAHPWITAMHVPGEERPVRGGPIVKAFHAALATIQQPPDVVVKLDADVSFEVDFFERLIRGFLDDPSLGLTGGECYEQNATGQWVMMPVTRDHVRGATRAYRWQCLQDVTPLEERMGWDGIDELKAEARGWRIRCLPGVRFLHHRGLGERERSNWSKWVAQGDMAHFMGYRPSYLLLRALYRAVRYPNAIAMIWGYLLAVITRRPRCSDEPAIAQLRRHQSVQSLPARAREALGLRR